MELDIAPLIKELLYENDQITIPGFGALVLSYAPSTIDHVQGLLNPPSKLIEFDSNVVVNDGKLVHLIQKNHQLSGEQAKEVIDLFVSQLKDKLDAREMVMVPDVGRLYKDFEGNIQFIADTTNFNKDSFGLPTVNFYPVLRNKTVAETPPPPSPKSGKSPAVASSTAKTGGKPFWEGWQQYLQKNAWIPIVAFSLIISLLLFFLVLPKFSGSGNSLAGNRVNQSPTQVVDSDADDNYSENEDAVDFQDETEQPESDVVDTESITVPPNQKECVVSVGVFGVKENAQRQIQKIYEAGFDAYNESITRRGKTLTKVGINFGYETRDEFDRMILEIKDIFPEAVVLKEE